MVRYIIIKGKKIRLLPLPSHPNDPIPICPKCRRKFNAGTRRRACFQLCGHIRCFKCILKLKHSCLQVLPQQRLDTLEDKPEISSMATLKTPRVLLTRISVQPETKSDSAVTPEATPTVPTIDLTGDDLTPPSQTSPKVTEDVDSPIKSPSKKRKGSNGVAVTPKKKIAVATSEVSVQTYPSALQQKEEENALFKRPATPPPPPVKDVPEVPPVWLERSLQCIFCQAKFSRQGTLEWHMENVHGVRTKIRPEETPPGGEYCPDCASLFGVHVSCFKVAYTDCGHISCMECVIQMELKCDQCKKETYTRAGWNVVVKQNGKLKVVK